MQHEPGRLLSYADVASELRASDTFLMTGKKPDRDKPLPQPELRILEDRSDFD